MEIRFQSNSTIEEVKQKIYKMTGTLPEQQSLFLIRQGTDTKIPLSPDACTLDDFNVESDDQLYVLDRNAQQNAFTQIMQESKHYKQRIMSFEEYKNRQNTVYNEIQNRLQNDQQFKEQYENSMKKRQEIDNKEKELASQMRIGERCEYNNKFRGVLLKIEKVQDLGEGLYCKVCFDEPIGDLEGGFVKYVKIQDLKVGSQYVECDLFESSSESSL